MALAKSQHEASRFVTALFRNADAAERAYRAAVVLGYKDADIKPAKGADLGGPTGGTLGTIAPVIAAVRDGAILIGVKARSAEDVQRLEEQ